MEEITIGWSGVMNSLKGKHAAINNLLKGKTVAYIDIPVHFNVGDLLIYLGTEAFFKDNGIDVVYRADAKHVSFNKLKNVDAIVMHGGGNFGDLYDHGGHQTIREKIASKFTDKLIVCLPQTIFFSKTDRMEKSAEIFSKHKNFHFFVRDLKSLEVAKRFSSKASLMPDMAHSLHPLVDISEVGQTNRLPQRLLNLVRNDIEGNVSKISRGVTKRSFDWSDMITISDRVLRKAYWFSVLFFGSRSVALWNKISEDVVFRACSMFCQYDVVYTDRLHGMILSSLLGKKTILYDNSYGKNTTYYDLWLSKCEIIHKASD